MIAGCSVLCDAMKPFGEQRAVPEMVKASEAGSKKGFSSTESS